MAGGSGGVAVGGDQLAPGAQVERPGDRKQRGPVGPGAAGLDDAAVRWDANEITLPELIEETLAAAATLNRLAGGAGTRTGSGTRPGPGTTRKAGVAERRPAYRGGSHEPPRVAERWRTFAMQLPRLADGMEHGGVEQAMALAAFRAFLDREAGVLG